jgi:prophage antirepressor-like protein
MTNLQIIAHESFCAKPVDVFRKDGSEWMTRQQIAGMLDVSDDSIRKIHDRYEKRFSLFSVSDKMSGTDGKVAGWVKMFAKQLMEVAMTNDLIVKTFENHNVRIVDQDGEQWWVAKDVCDVLELSNPSMIVQRLDDDEKQKIDPKQYLGSVSNEPVTVINESGHPADLSADCDGLSNAFFVFLHTISVL